MREMPSFLLGFGDLNYFPHINSFLDGQTDIIKTTLSVSDRCSPFSVFLFRKIQFMSGFSSRFAGVELPKL